MGAQTISVSDTLADTARARLSRSGKNGWNELNFESVIENQSRNRSPQTVIWGPLVGPLARSLVWPGCPVSILPGSLRTEA